MAVDRESGGARQREQRLRAGIAVELWSRGQCSGQSMDSARADSGPSPRGCGCVEWTQWSRAGLNLQLRRTCPALSLHPSHNSQPPVAVHSLMPAYRASLSRLRSVSFVGHRRICRPSVSASLPFNSLAMSTSTSTSSLTSSIHQVILATFAADSLSLSAHWEYQAEAISRAFNGKVDRLTAPIASYHAGKAAGDQTHIGDNALLLLEHLAQAPEHRLNLPAYLQAWQAKWDVVPPPAYVDHATKTVLQGLKEGKGGAELGSTDDDLSHSSKFFPLLASPAYQSDEEELVKATRALVSAFQRGETELLSGELLARVAFRVIVGRQRPSAAIEAVTAQLNNPWLTERVKVGKASAGVEDGEALRSFGDRKELANGKVLYTGLACPTKYGIPAVVHYVEKYEGVEDPTVALVEDVSAGGNSNARSMAVALLLFGHKGGVKGCKVEEFIAGIQQRQHIEQLLTSIETDHK